MAPRNEREVLEAELEQIRVFCRGRRKKQNEDVFQRIFEIVSGPMEDDLDKEARLDMLRDRRQTAVSLLLLIADPPGEAEFNQALKKLGTVVGRELTDIMIVEPGQPSQSLKSALRSKVDRSQKADLLVRMRPARAETHWVPTVDDSPEDSDEQN